MDIVDNSRHRIVLPLVLCSRNAQLPPAPLLLMSASHLLSGLRDPAVGGRLRPTIQCRVRSHLVGELDHWSITRYAIKDRHTRLMNTLSGQRPRPSIELRLLVQATAAKQPGRARGERRRCGARGASGAWKRR